MGAFGIKDGSRIMIRNKKTGKFELYVDYANKFEIDLKGGSLFAKAQGEKAIRWDKPLDGGLKMAVDILNPRLLAMMLCSELISSDTLVMKKDELLVGSDHSITIPKGFDNTSGSIIHLAKDNSELENLKIINTGSTASVGEVLVSSNKATFHTDIEVGDTVRFVWLENSKDAKHFTVYGNSSAPNYEIYANVEAKLREGGEPEFKQVVFYNASPKRNFKLACDADKPSSFNLEFDLLSDKNHKMLDWIEL